ASAGPRRLASLRARPALGVSVGKQQSHYCDTEQNKTDRAHGSYPPVPLFRKGLPARRLQDFQPQLSFTPFIFWTAKCEVAHTSLPIRPSKVRHGDIYLAPGGVHGKTS